MFNLPWRTVGVGVTIMPLRDGVKVIDMLAGKVVLLFRDDRVSTLLPIVGVGVTILPLRDGVKMIDVLAGKVVLIFRDDRVSTLLSI